jgi:hypothetical protein
MFASEAPDVTSIVGIDDVLASLLSNLVNLVALHIDLDPYYLREQWPSCGNLFNNCTFRLRTFYCNFRLDDNLNGFLAKQPTISEFGWLPERAGLDPFVFPPALLPNLKIFSLPFCLYVDGYLKRGFSNITQGRPITHFSWPRRPFKSIYSLRMLGISAESLRVLYTTADGLEILEDLAELLPSLECLGVVPTEVPSSLSSSNQKRKHLHFILSHEGYRLCYHEAFSLPTSSRN